MMYSLNLCPWIVSSSGVAGTADHFLPPILPYFVILSQPSNLLYALFSILIPIPSSSHGCTISDISLLFSWMLALLSLFLYVHFPPLSLLSFLLIFTSMLIIITRQVPVQRAVERDEIPYPYKVHDTTLRPLLNITIQKHNYIANYISRIY